MFATKFKRFSTIRARSLDRPSLFPVWAGTQARRSKPQSRDLTTTRRRCPTSLDIRRSRFWLRGTALPVDLQRALYTVYGINIESVTMVTAFMLGLASAVWSAASSRDPKRPVLLYFALVSSIGVFGVCRLIFHAVGRNSACPQSYVRDTFLLVLMPTLLMGAHCPCSLPTSFARIKTSARASERSTSSTRSVRRWRRERPCSSSSARRGSSVRFVSRRF